MISPKHYEIANVGLGELSTFVGNVQRLLSRMWNSAIAQLPTKGLLIHRFKKTVTKNCVNFHCRTNNGESLFAK